MSLGHWAAARLLVVDLAHHAVGFEPGFVLRGPIGCIRPDPAPGVDRLDQTFVQKGTVALGGIGNDLTSTARQSPAWHDPQGMMPFWR